MTDQITLGAASVMGALTVGTALVRWAVAPVSVGRHRARTVTVLDDASLDELLGEWPGPVLGAVVAQAWRWCPSCVREEPSVLHRGGWTCGHCFENTTAGVAGGAS